MNRYIFAIQFYLWANAFIKQWTMALQDTHTQIGLNFIFYVPLLDIVVGDIFIIFG